MLTIWKHTLRIEDQQTLELPKGARLLCVQVQHGAPTLWFLCNPAETEREARSIHIYGTGHALPDAPGSYVGTFQVSSGHLVFHVFEIPED